MGQKTHLQTELEPDVARNFRVLCLKMRTTIKKKLAELIQNELEFFGDLTDEELNEFLETQKQRGDKQR